MKVPLLATLAGCAIAIAGCYAPSPTAGAPCADNRDCPTGLVCSVDDRCEEPGTGIDAAVAPDGCPADTCSGDMLVVCGVPAACVNGCGGTTPHCLELAPSNGVTTALLVGADANVMMDKLRFDADDGSLRVMNTDVRPPGTGVQNGIGFEIVNGMAVFTANSWTLPVGDSWTFEGDRPIVLFANTTITIAAPLDGGATTSVGRLGGSDGNASTTTGMCRGRAGRALDPTHGEGGGGGGGGNTVAGGAGGASNLPTPTGIGGSCATAPTTIPLGGGNSGGHGGANAINAGGAGGGAIALVAMQTVTITSSVAVPGAGGASGATGNGGGGGGGGGAILIEAPVVVITGQLTANGGAGGAPSGGADGARGSVNAATAAIGGNYAGSGGPARGGNGGAGALAPTAGASYTFDDGVGTITVRGGGGGGAAGVIEVKRRVGGVSGLASPAAAITDAVFQ